MSCRLEVVTKEKGLIPAWVAQEDLKEADTLLESLQNIRS